MQPPSRRPARTISVDDFLRLVLRSGLLSRDQLLDLAHGRGPEPFDRSIDIRVTRLRHKLETDPAKPQIIKTVRGVGYVFMPDESA